MKIEIITEKNINLSKLEEEIRLQFPSLQYSNHILRNKILEFYFESAISNKEKTILKNIVNAHTANDIEENIKRKVENAMGFGQEIMNSFIVENVLLGITKLGLTSHVRTTTRELISCLQTGSLYDAISELKKISPDDLDSVILSESRLLEFRNKIHTFLGLPLATIWNED